MNAEIIAIGTEILLGHILNTNQSYLSKELAALGINVYYHTAVGDNPKRLGRMLDLAMARSDLVITTGGLGPTVDDITLETIASVCGRNLLPDDAVRKQVEMYFKRRKISKIPQNAMRQALVPENSEWLKNSAGTAPGIIIEHGGSVVIALPGPPREMNAMFELEVVPYLLKKGFADGTVIKTRTIKTTGLGEAIVDAKVKDLLKMSGDTTVGIYSSPGLVQLKVTTKASNTKSADRKISAVAVKIKRRLGDHVYGIDDQTLEGCVVDLLIKHKKKLAIAESCTGGLIAHRITNVSGCSLVFDAGAVTYSNGMKTKILSVDQNIIKKFGAVSAQTAGAMAKGALRNFGSDYAIAVTGIAGPAGGTKKKPVGLVYIAIAGKNMIKVKECRFSGNREEIKARTSTAALDILRRQLL